MKFIAIFAFAFVAAVNAGGDEISVTFTENDKCDGLIPPAYTDCGLNTLPSSQLYTEKYAYIVGNEYGITFYEDRLCEGGPTHYVEGGAGDECYDLEELDFVPHCLYIECAKVSCHIVVLLFTLITLI